MKSISHALMQFRSDINALYENKGKIKKIFSPAFNCSIQACLLIRLAQHSHPTIFFIFRRILISHHGIDIGRGIKIGNGLVLPHPTGIVLGAGAVIGRNVTIFQNTTIGQKNGIYPEIEDNVTIYPNSVIVGRVNIQKDNIIYACSYIDPRTITTTKMGNKKRG